jgi:hypothetical protein
MTRLWRSMRLAVLALAGLFYVVMDYLASSSHQPPLYAVVVGQLR